MGLDQDSEIWYWDCLIAQIKKKSQIINFFFIRVLNLRGMVHLTLVWFIFILDRDCSLNCIQRDTSIATIYNT